MTVSRRDSGDRSEPVIATGDGPAVVDVGLLVAHTAGEDERALQSFASRIARDVADELDGATALPWRFFLAEPEPLARGDGRYRPSEFLDDAMRRMVEGPYDLIVVVTDVPVVSRRQRTVPGLASPLSRIAVVSTHGLTREHRARGTTPLDDDAVRWNSGALVLHLLGHVLGAGHAPADRAVGSDDGGASDGDGEADGSGESEGSGEGGGETGRDAAMAPFDFDPARRSVPDFDADVARLLERVARDIPPPDAPRGLLGRAAFHLRSTARNPREIVGALAASRALALPLSLPRLATAGVAPALVLLFSAETWDVGIHLSNGSAALFAAVSVLAAAVHLLFVHDLLFPRRPHPVLTEHVAVVNVTVAAMLVLAALGLFGLVAGIALVVELVVFPQNLMTNWPSLEDPTVGFVDLVRTAAFIGTIGVLSGALGGGLENRDVVRHLALFLDRP